MDEFEDDDMTNSNRKSKNRTPKPQVPTWADAAKKVLERYDYALPHKQILQTIQDENLKPCGRGTMPLACLNAMLNSNCKGKDALFYRAPGQAACFGLKINQPKDTADEDGESTTSSESQTQTDSSTVQPEKPHNSQSASTSKPKEVTRNAALRSARLKANMQRSRNPTATMPGSPGAALVAMPPRKPGAALCVMPPKKRPKLDAGDDDDGAKDLRDSFGSSKGDPSLSSSPSASSSAWTSEGERDQNTQELSKTQREAKLQQNLQRLERHKEHQQQLAERSRQQQQQLRMVHENKRGLPFGPRPPLPREQKDIDEIVRQIKLEQQEQLQRDSLRQQRKSMQVKLNRNRHMNRRKPVTQANPPPAVQENKVVVKKPPPVTGFLEVKLKRLKKMSMVEQIKRTKEGKVDLQNPESLFATISLKSFLNNAMFKALPASYQYQLLMLLPDVDRVKDKDGIVRMMPNALTNEFFTKACLEWQEKLLDGEFNVDIIQRVKQEEGKSITLDPWKEKYFEPAWGVSSVPDPIADDNKNTTDGVSPEVFSKERETAWSTFLKFSENSANEHSDEFKGIQKILRQKAESEAIRRSLQRKQQLLRSPTSQKSRMENVAKDRSRRAIKRAHLYQKKLFLEKQLMEINAKLADKAQALSDDIQQRLVFKKREITITLRKMIENMKEGKRISETNLRPGETSMIASGSGLEFGKIRSEEELRRREKRKAKKKKRSKERSDENELLSEEYAKYIGGKDGIPLNFVSERRSHSKKHKKDKHKKKKHSRDLISKDGSHHHSSKIVKGPSVYVKKTSIACPCKLAPMKICNGCGSFCHSDCINADKLCTLCVPA